MKDGLVTTSSVQYTEEGVLSNKFEHQIDASNHYSPGGHRQYQNHLHIRNSAVMCWYIHFYIHSFLLLNYHNERASSLKTYSGLILIVSEEKLYFMFQILSWRNAPTDWPGEKSLKQNKNKLMLRPYVFTGITHHRVIACCTACPATGLVNFQEHDKDDCFISWKMKNLYYSMS